MLQPSMLVKQAEKFVRSNSPAILAGLGITGVVTTGYLAHQAGYTTAYEIMYYEIEGGKEPTKKEMWKRRAQANWKSYIPVALTGAITIGCIIGATRIGNRRTATLAAAYSLSERAFSEYKEKVVEKLGERKEQSIRDELAQEKVAGTAPSREVVLVGGGTVLCCELHTGRYFLSDHQTIKKAVNDINFRVLNHEYATLTDFYHLIGLPATSSSSDFGWTSDKQMEISISSVFAEDTRPCLAFEYNYVKAL